MRELHPRELEPLTEASRAGESERQTIEQSAQHLSDLAHSLKTPLAVLRTRLDSDASEAELREDVATQVRRMNELVSYQLGRGASGGHQLFAAPVEIEPYAEEIVRGLEKIYAGRGTVCEFDIDAAELHGEPANAGKMGQPAGERLQGSKSRVLLGKQARERRAGAGMCWRWMTMAGIPTDGSTCCRAACAATRCRARHSM